MTTLQARAASAYANVNLESRAGSNNGVDLVILLLEGVLDRIKLARSAMAERDLQQKIKHINKSLEIIGEGLRVNLNLAAGGEIATNLDDLYAYCSVRLLHANSRNDANALDDVARVLTPLLAAWVDLRKGGNQAGAAESLVHVTRSLKSAVPGVQRLYGSSAYAMHSALGA